MDNIITGIIGLALFLLFVGGLAQSIGSVAFGIIVAVIGVMALYDLWENIRDARRAAQGETMGEAASDTTHLD